MTEEQFDPEVIEAAIEAHDDGRHGSTHPDDIKAWAGLGCPKCRERMTR